MRGWRSFLGVTAALFVLAPFGAAQAAPDLQMTTKANLQAAMHREAFAYAEYTVFAKAALKSRNTDVSKLFEQTSAVELRGHFAPETKLMGVVGDNLANLQAGISGESQDLTDYDRWAREAKDDHCTTAADLFAEVRRDEAGHLIRYASAAQALVDPGSGATVPDPPTVTPVAVRPGPPSCSARTTGNLLAAMRGEAFAAARYTLFADAARASGQPRLAALFEGAAGVELNEHFTAEANLAGAVGDDARNLQTAVNGETKAATANGSYADAASRVGDRSAAELFRRIQREEQQHGANFRKALVRSGAIPLSA